MGTFIFAQSKYFEIFFFKKKIYREKKFWKKKKFPPPPGQFERPSGY